MPVLQTGDAVPATPLVDQTGRAISLEDFKSRTLLVSFIYTRCPDPRECPLISAKFARMQSLLRDAPVHLVELTLDPAHDDVPALRRYGAEFGAQSPRWSLATGAPAALQTLETRLGIVTAARQGSPGVVHSESVVFVDGGGRIADRIDGAAWNPDDVAARARSIAGARPSALPLLRLWLARGVSALCGGGGSGISTGAALLLFAGILAGFGVTVARLFRVGPR